MNGGIRRGQPLRDRLTPGEWRRRLTKRLRRAITPRASSAPVVRGRANSGGPDRGRPGAVIR